MILSGISRPITQLQAICVKYIKSKSLQNHPADLGDFDENHDKRDSDRDNDGVKDEQMHEWNYDLIDKSCYIQTFKIYSKTMFDDIKKAACTFWDIKPFDDYILTDEYFNSLSTYKDPIQTFYSQSQGYRPQNPEGNACVFLMKKNAEKTKLHPLQYESVEIKDDNSKKDQ